MHGSKTTNRLMTDSDPTSATQEKLGQNANLMTERRVFELRGGMDKYDTFDELQLLLADGNVEDRNAFDNSGEKLPHG